MIDSVKQVKQRPDEQILVTGIIGWPENADLSEVKYRIDKDTTSLPVEQQKLWDTLPICTRPDQKAADANIVGIWCTTRIPTPDARKHRWARGSRLFARATERHRPGPCCN